MHRLSVVLLACLFYVHAQAAYPKDKRTVDYRKPNSKSYVSYVKHYNRQYDWDVPFPQSFIEGPAPLSSWCAYRSQISFAFTDMWEGWEKRHGASKSEMNISAQHVFECYSSHCEDGRGPQFKAQWTESGLGQGADLGSGLTPITGGGGGISGDLFPYDFDGYLPSENFPSRCTPEMQSSPRVSKYAGWIMETNPDPDYMADIVRDYGPIVVMLSWREPNGHDFYTFCAEINYRIDHWSYTGPRPDESLPDVFVCPGCSKWYMESNGYMTIVGYGERCETVNNCTKYWIMKTPFGPHIGYDGFCYIERGTNTAGVENQFHRVLTEEQFGRAPSESGATVINSHVDGHVDWNKPHLKTSGGVNGYCKWTGGIRRSNGEYYFNPGACINGS